jgi:hypothetical protein
MLSFTASRSSQNAIPFPRFLLFEELFDVCHRPEEFHRLIGKR